MGLVHMCTCVCVCVCACCVRSRFSRPTLCDSMGCSPPGSSVHGDSPGKNTIKGCHALLQEIFPTQGLNPRLLHGQASSLPLNHLGSPNLGLVPPANNSLVLDQTEELFPSLGLFFFQYLCFQHLSDGRGCGRCLNISEDLQCFMIFYVFAKLTAEFCFLPRHFTSGDFCFMEQVLDQRKPCQI